jgi:hypothetical protein
MATMSGELFDTTLPAGEPELMRVSAFRRYLGEGDTESAEAAPSRLSSLSPSMQADLARFEQDGGGSEILEVMAACVRHAKRLTMQLQFSDRVVPLTVFPNERLVHCPMDLAELIEKYLPELRVLHVESALLGAPDDADTALAGEPHLYSALTPLLWELAMRGLRSELLPEIAGAAVYRVAPGLDIDNLPAKGAVLAAAVRLRRQAASLRDIADWPGLDRPRTARLLNALYLQGGLIVSRSHPDAVGDGWFRSRGRN